MYHILVFRIDQQQIAIELSKVERVIWVVEITELPNSSEFCKGVINIQGKIVPVIDLRKIFGHPPKEISLSDQLIICNTGQKNYALYIDCVIGVTQCERKDLTPSKDVFPNMKAVESVYKENGEITFIYNLESIPNIITNQREMAYD